MFQELVHKCALAFGESGQMGDASIQIPNAASFAEYFKNPIAEDQEARTGRNAARPSWKINSAKHAHQQTGGRKEEWIRLAGKQNNGGRMTAPGPGHRSADTVINA